MENFQNTLDFYNLHEIAGRGPTHTRNNGRDGADFTMEKLDKVVENHAWHNMYHNVDVLVDHTIFSDHLPILINQGGSKNFQRKMRLFRFEAQWGEKLECRNVVKKIWRRKKREQGMWKSILKKLKDDGGVKWAGDSEHDLKDDGGVK